MFALAVAWNAAAGRAQWIGCKQLCMHGSELRESSASTQQSRDTPDWLARPSSAFLTGLRYRAEMCHLCHWSTNLTCCGNFSLSLLSRWWTAVFFWVHTDCFSCMWCSLINANYPETCLCDYDSQAWEGLLIPLMSHKRRRIIHSSSLGIGWYFNIWRLTLGVYLPTELARAQMPSDAHLHK